MLAMPRLAMSMKNAPHLEPVSELQNVSIETGSKTIHYEQCRKCGGLVKTIVSHFCAAKENCRSRMSFR